MAVKRPEPSPENILRFNKLLIGYLDEKGHNDAWLARKTGLSKTTISKMVQNKDYRGGYYCPSVESLVAVCLALDITAKQRWEMYSLVFPEHAIYFEAMNNGYSVAHTNAMLEEKNLPALTDP